MLPVFRSVLKSRIEKIEGNTFDLRVYVKPETDLLETMYEFVHHVFGLGFETSCFSKHGKRYRVFTSERKDDFAIVTCSIETHSFVIFSGDDGTCEKNGFSVEIVRREQV